MTKNCKKCNVEKDISQFHYCKTTKDRLRNECRSCVYASARARILLDPIKTQIYQKKYREVNKEKLYKLGKEYWKTKKLNPMYMLNARYRLMKSRVTGSSTHKSSAFGKELCSKQEYLEWANNTQKQFLELHKNWVESGCKLKYTPTIDRINNNIGYIPSNMQWLTQSDNRKKENVCNK